MTEPPPGHEPPPGNEPVPGHEPVPGRRRPDEQRRLGCAGAFWTVLAGAVVGYCAAAVVDLLTTADWQGVWTLGSVAAGSLALTAVAFWLVRSGRTSRRGLRTLRRRLWKLYEPVSLMAALAVAYVSIWLTGPRLTVDTAVRFGLLGVLVWPLIAGTVRILFGRPMLRPPWWSALWLFLGVVPTTAILLIRAGHVYNRFDGVIGGVVILVPVAVWRWIRTRRRLRRPV